MPDGEINCPRCTAGRKYISLMRRDRDDTPDPDWDYWKCHKCETQWRICVPAIAYAQGTEEGESE